jgi:hypothetical protein
MMGLQPDTSNPLLVSAVLSRYRPLKWANINIMIFDSGLLK